MLPTATEKMRICLDEVNTSGCLLLPSRLHLAVHVGPVVESAAGVSTDKGWIRGLKGDKVSNI